MRKMHVSEFPKSATATSPKTDSLNALAHLICGWKSLVVYNMSLSARNQKNGIPEADFTGINILM